MKSFSERNPIVVGAIGVGLVAAITVASLQYQNLPFINQNKEYSAYFPDAGGLITGAPVQVSGMDVGRVETISLDNSKVIVKWVMADDVKVGDRTEAAIKTRSLLGSKYLEVTPRGSKDLDGTIPMDRTTAPYQLPDALGDLATTVSGLDTNKVNESLATLAQTFQDTPPDLKVAVQGVARFSESLNKRDEQLRNLLANANKVSGVLGQRSDQILQLVNDTNTLLVALRNESSALDSISYNISSVAQQLKGFIDENKGQFKQTFDQLNGVLTILDNRKTRVQLSLNLLNKYALSFGEALSSGPFFKAYLQNLLPGQFVQPFVDAAFSDLGLDPNTLLPSERGDPQTGQKATPALPIPYPRTGQGGEPRLTIPDAITGNQGDQGCGPPGIPLPGPTGCYPYREPIPPGPPGGPPPGPPLPPAQDYSTVPTPQPAIVPAPGQLPGAEGSTPTGPAPGPTEGGQ